MAELAVLVPSRGRPHNAERLAEAFEKTCRGDTRLVFGLDEDDETRWDYFDLECEALVNRDLRHRLVEWLNFLASFRAEPYIGHIGDDNVPWTVGWDVRVMESLKRNQFCFCNDLDPGRVPGSLSIHIFMRRSVVDTLGYMGPPAIQHMYVDPIWYAWGKATSIEFLEDVELPHLHYTLGHAPSDESYEHSTGLIPTDLVRYQTYCDSYLNQDIHKLGGTPYTQEALAEFNHKLNIPWPH